MSGIGASSLYPRNGGAGATFAAQPAALAPLMLVKRRAVDLCRVDSCLCRCS
jgi:hypothetical protein